ncbi:MAG: hypothetical protein P8J20_10005 [Novosphingobium sp.]|nr:hypothetical protein [Novosphingobium sp.]
MSEKIFILDEIEVAQPDAAQLRDAYLAQYVPMARERGMVLEGAWTSPAIELPDRSLKLHFMWSVPDVGAWWAMRLGAARADPDQDVPITGSEEKTRWWAWVDNLAISRKRTFLRDMAEVNDV